MKHTIPAMQYLVGTRPVHQKTASSDVTKRSIKQKQINKSKDQVMKVTYDRGSPGVCGQVVKEMAWDFTTFQVR